MRFLLVAFSLVTFFLLSCNDECKHDEECGYMGVCHNGKCYQTEFRDANDVETEDQDGEVGPDGDQQ